MSRMRQLLRLKYSHKALKLPPSVACRFVFQPHYAPPRYIFPQNFIQFSLQFTDELKTTTTCSFLFYFQSRFKKEKGKKSRYKMRFLKAICLNMNKSKDNVMHWQPEINTCLFTHPTCARKEKRTDPFGVCQAIVKER